MKVEGRILTLDETALHLTAMVTKDHFTSEGGADTLTPMDARLLALKTAKLALQFAVENPPESDVVYDLP